MVNKNIHFPVNLDYNEFTYYRVSLKNSSEFGDLCKTIKYKTKRHLPIPKPAVDRFFFLLEEVFKRELEYYSPFIERSVEMVCKYFKPYEKYYFEREPYYWDDKKHIVVNKPKIVNKSVAYCMGNGFRDMIEFVISTLISLDKEERLDENTCIYNAFLLLSIYKNNWMTFSINKQEKLKPYKLTVIAGYITKEIFEFKIINHIDKEDRKNENYNQAAKYQALLVKKKYPECFGKNPAMFKPMSMIFGKIPPEISQIFQDGFETVKTI